ncbi:hypothetical protein EHS25_001920 [Saitozyma podzolica]|uniref:Mid2 domain-containing protein n=1 Tax=Saitozyma podzolica TaxID=1890683 RepID=A0A427YG76_9TREE|nr:hypothetical protein EHS25_001920 [Saitozyma podzolica]
MAVAGLVALRTTLAQNPSEGHFYFQWPHTTAQCEVVTLTWNNAMPPFSAWILPMGNQPFLYNIPESAYLNGSGSYNVQLQLDSGTNYIVAMSDAFGGVSEIQQVAGFQSTACLNTASRNQTASQFSWSVSGQANQCETGFDVTWSATAGDEPYNFTVLPLDQGFYPFDVALPTDLDYESSWRLNLTAGTRFTIVMNSNKGRGTGGVGGIYEVSNSSSLSCITASVEATGSWPVGIATNTLPAANIPTSSSTAHAPLSRGATAGIIVGAVAVLIIFALLLLFVLRRRRRRRSHGGAIGGNGLSQLDLADVEYTEVEIPGPVPMIEPYRDAEMFRPPGGRGREPVPSPTSTGATDNEQRELSSFGRPGMGAGQGRGFWAIHNHISEDDAVIN